VNEHEAWRATLARLVRGHALGWLVAANVVGVWLAAVLVWPQAGAWLGEFTYGRWMPVHMNWQLYGWCALPLVGALLAACLHPGHAAAKTHARLALGGWTLALAAGGAAWLGGVTSGKLFLDWAGGARPVLGVAMSLLWTVLAAHLWWRRAEAGTARWRVAAGLVASLAAVPGMMYWVAGREVFPTVNPDSGGATGASLLGSTLGIVTVFGLLPLLLGTRRREGARTAWFWWALAGSFAVFAGMDRGNASHHAAGQIAGLGLLLAWVPLLWIYGYACSWSAGSRRWAVAAGVWWALLVTSGWATFFPGISEAWKFTHALVGHAHLAMAGLVTAVNFVVLNELDPARPTGGRGVFWWWQGGCAAHVGLMLGLGAVEAERAAELFYGADWTRVIFAARLAAGAAMLAGSAWAWGVVVWRRGKQS
jgi:cytochrome c oxidase cbb3-type subunit 1